LLASAFSPQPLLTAQTLVEGYGLQLIHDPGARLHHAVPVPQQLPQIPVLPTRHPDLRKTIFEQQAQNQLRILAIRLLLPYSLGTDLGRVSNPQLNLQLGQQSFEPARVSTGLHTHTHLLPACSNSAIELLRLFAMREPFFLELSGVSIHRSNLLKLGVEIYSYNDHCSAPFSRACWLASAPPTLLGPGSRHCHGINYTHLTPSGFRLASPRLWRVEHNAGEMNRPSPLAFFSICAVVDFVFGLVKWHSVVAGIVAIVCGLPLTGLLFLGFRASWKGNDDSGAPGT